jgi:hypothetical protein
MKRNESKDRIRLVFDETEGTARAAFFVDFERKLREFLGLNRQSALTSIKRVQKYGWVVVFSRHAIYGVD